MENQQQNKKKTRGRPKNQVKSNNNNNSNSNEFIESISTTNNNVTEIQQQNDENLPVPIELQNSSIDIIGYDNTMKLIEITNNNVFKFCNYLKIFQMYKDKPIPNNWYKDDYWMYTLDERIHMLNEAFELQDDEAELKNTQPGEYKCTSCGCNRILLQLRQVRSADEPMTQYFKCAECKKSWVRH